MIPHLIHRMFKLAEKFTGKRFWYYTPNTHNALGTTAVKAAAGFWYVGNVYDVSDVAYGIAQNGVVEKNETVLVDNILKSAAPHKQPVVYDIGANTGYYSIFAAYSHKAYTVAFEPVPAHVACLDESVQLNGLTDRVRVFTCALGETPETKDLYLGGSGSSLNPDFLGDQHADHISVTVEPLDTLASREQLPSPDFIKIDVEGHELAVLRGAQKLLRASTPVLFVEISASLIRSHSIFRNSHYAATFELLSSMGYAPYRLEGNTLIKYDSNDTVREGVCMYLFMHPGIHDRLAATLGISLI